MEEGDDSDEESENRKILGALFGVKSANETFTCANGSPPRPAPSFHEVRFL